MIPECPALTEEGMGRLSCLGVTGADLDGGQGPSADGGRGAAWCNERTEVAERSRASHVPRGPQAWRAHRSRTCPGWCVCWGLWGKRVWVRSLGTGRGAAPGASGASYLPHTGSSESRCRMPGAAPFPRPAGPPSPPSCQVSHQGVTGCSRLIIGCPRQRAGA